MDQIYLKIKKMVLELLKRYNLKIEINSPIETKNNAQRFTKFIQNNYGNQNNILILKNLIISMKIIQRV